ncbi:putative glucuronosyltransferase [Helianthus annuus]|nr:putative glucuronosyltransferase [Helianthus annuus]KAJ0633576.1 putative glucuronosyltransferase [Helianthus annuus]
MAPTHTPKISSSITLVYLDADTIVVKNIDVLFKCGKFCANLKHSERLNSGVMVVEPSEEHFNDMVIKVFSMPITLDFPVRVFLTLIFLPKK